MDASVEQKRLKQDFIDWLREGLLAKTIPLNQPGGNVHIIAGYLFLRSPQIFSAFLKQSRYEFERCTPVQKAFESLRLHRTNKKNPGGLVQCRLENGGGEPGHPVYRKASGYLVKTNSLLEGVPAEDSPFIVFD